MALGAEPSSRLNRPFSSGLGTRWLICRWRHSPTHPFPVETNNICSHTPGPLSASPSSDALGRTWQQLPSWLCTGLRNSGFFQHFSSHSWELFVSVQSLFSSRLSQYSWKSRALPRHIPAHPRLLPMLAPPATSPEPPPAPCPPRLYAFKTDFTQFSLILPLFTSFASSFTP